MEHEEPAIEVEVVEIDGRTPPPRPQEPPAPRPARGPFGFRASGCLGLLGVLLVAVAGAAAALVFWLVRGAVRSLGNMLRAFGVR